MYLGLDLGTSALKALLIDDSERLVATASRNITTTHPRSGWAEQSPESWIDAAKTVLAELHDIAPEEYAKIAAIGLSGQMHSLVVLDESDTPIRPAILWNDVRGDEWCIETIATFPEATAISGVRPMPSFTAAKLAWLRRFEPESFKRIRRIVLPKDYLRLWLTGEIATDPSDAGGTQLFDQANRNWSTKILADLEVSLEYLPRILDGTSVAGTVRRSVADEVGLSVIPVICGGGDAATSSIGTGCITAGASMLSLGTGAVYLSVQDSYRTISNDSIHNFAHCLPNTWYHMGALLNCGSALEWICKVTGQRPADILQRISASHRAPSGVLFLPYLDGVRTPHGNAEVRGSFFGLDRAASAEDLVQAVVEGVTFALADADQALMEVGNKLDSPLLLGGGAKSLFWTNLIATVFQRPVRRVVDAETGSALGAARLAMIGTQAASLEAMAPPPSEIAEPIHDLCGLYQDRLGDFRAMYSSAERYAQL